MAKLVPSGGFEPKPAVFGWDFLSAAPRLTRLVARRPTKAEPTVVCFGLAPERESAVRDARPVLGKQTHPVPGTGLVAEADRVRSDRQMERELDSA